MRKKTIVAKDKLNDQNITSTFQIEYSPLGNYILIKNNYLQKTYVVDKTKKIKKQLMGDGIFLNNHTLLYFYNDSGYGYMNSDGYLYDLKKNRINKISVDDGFVFFISFSATILRTKNWLLLKDDHGGLYLYNIEKIIKKRSLTPQYFNLHFDDIIKLISFSFSKKNLIYLNNKYQIVVTEINFKHNFGIPYKIEENLNISNKFYRGYCLDFFTTNKYKKYNVNSNSQHTEIGELLYRYKYKCDESVFNKLIDLINGKLYAFLKEVDVICPIPPSDTNRKYQPVYEISREIGKRQEIPVDTKYILKTRQTPALKSIDENNQRYEILKNAFKVKDQKYKNKTMLLIDDFYRSGETLNAVAKIISEKGDVKNVFALVILKIKEKLL